MSFFLFGLLLKIAMAASIVVAASVIVERSGPFVGSLVAALPTAGGAAMIILALEHPPEFIAQSAIGSLIANAACAFFALTYAALAQRRSLQLSLGGAFLVWLVIVFLLRLVEWNAVGAVLLNAVVYPIAIAAAGRFRITGAVKRIELSGVDLAWRAGVVTLCVVLVHGGKQLDRFLFFGHFCLLPGGDGSFFIILHPRIGGPAAASVAAHVLTPADRAGPWPARRASAGRADRRVVVLRNRTEHRHRLERVAVGAAQAQIIAVALFPTP
jgi:uncharacterized membrane protein (GlpM family)